MVLITEYELIENQSRVFFVRARCGIYAMYAVDVKSSTVAEEFSLPMVEQEKS
jgi:hypothetical protein